MLIVAVAIVPADRSDTEIKFLFRYVMQLFYAFHVYNVCNKNMIKLSINASPPCISSIHSLSRVCVLSSEYR